MKGILTKRWFFIDKSWAGCEYADVFPIPDNNLEVDTETIETQTVERPLYKWSASSQAPWEINEGKPHDATKICRACH